MWASRDLRFAAFSRLASDTATLAQAAAPNHMVLIMEPFNPSEAIVAADLTPATFDGATPLEVVLGTQASGFEPGTDDSRIDILPPIGGFRWETTGITNLPQTIHGYALMNEAQTVVYATAIFETPKVLTAINQVVDGLEATLFMAKDTISE